MRIDEIKKINKELTVHCNMKTDEGRQKAIISVLTDISETLAILTDLYGMAHPVMKCAYVGEQNNATKA